MSVPPAIARALRRTTRRARLPAPLQPDAQRRDYLAAITRAVLRPARACLRGELDEIVGALAAHRAAQAAGTARIDATPEQHRAEAAVGRAAKLFADLWRPREVEALAQRVAEATDRHARRQLDRQVQAAFSIPYAAIEQPVRDRVPGFVAENVDLIRTVPTRYFSSIRDEVREAFAGGARPETLARRIEDRYGVAQSDAARIARDQIGKLNAQISQDRLTSLGSTRYLWRTVRDERVRDNHQALDGVECRWDTPPSGGGTEENEPGHPGTGIQCRCYADPIFDDTAAAPPEGEASTGGEAREEHEAEPAPAGDELAAEMAPTPRDPAGGLTGLEAAQRLAVEGLADADLDYLREGMRELAPFRAAYSAATAAGIDPTRVASSGEYPGGKFPPIRIEVDPAGNLYLLDGRHRYTAAREAGARAILAQITVRGPRGGKLREVPRAVVALKPDWPYRGE